MPYWYHTLATLRFELQKNEPNTLKTKRRVQNCTPRQAAHDQPEVGARKRGSVDYSWGSASGWTGTAEATGPGPAPSR
jgi:hypothetical protein